MVLLRMSFKLHVMLLHLILLSHMEHMKTSKLPISIQNLSHSDVIDKFTSFQKMLLALISCSNRNSSYLD